MSTRLQRFDFGSLRDFRGPITVTTVEDEVAELPPPPPPPTFSEEDLATACASAKKLGFAEGFDAGLARATEQADAKREAAENRMLALGQLTQQLQQNYRQLLTTEATELSQLVLMIARKVAGEALNERSHDTITALVSRCLPVILAKPRLIIDLNPEAFESTIDRLEKLLQAGGFEGEIQFRAAPQLGIHDVALDWGSGQAQRDTETLWTGIESLLSAMPVTLSETALPPITQPEVPQPITDDLTTPPTV
jgi:flagellar assembly protein FliH